MKSRRADRPGRGRLNAQLSFPLLVLLSSLWSCSAAAQDRWLVEGILDAELHDTDADSPSLSRNGGSLSGLARVQLWSAYQLSPQLQVYVLGEAEADDSSGAFESEAEIEQLALRYTSTSATHYFVEAGRILSPLNAFSNRHLSTLNPLIGEPLVYITSYPLGIQAAGSNRWLDYRAAMVDEPDINPLFVPDDPGSAYRPALGFGVTPFQGLRLGLSWTQGPYLHRRFDDQLPPGTNWRDFEQRVMGIDFQFSRGYLELNGQLANSRYDVPYQGRATDDTSWYLELKYTWTPRFYGAVRFSRITGAFISHEDGTSWATGGGGFGDLEVGIGYRFSPNVLFKVAYRRDHWDDSGDRDEAVPNGHSLAAQLSLSFDLYSRLAARR